MFRIKNHDRHYSDKRTTLDTRHQETLQHFNHQRKKNLPQKRKQLNELLREKKRLENLDSGNIPGQIVLRQLGKDIKNLEIEIDELENKKDQIDYLLITSKILNEYANSDNNKAELLDKYLIATGEKNPEIHREIETCPQCNSNLFMGLAHRVCTECGYATNDVLIENKLCYRDGQQTEIITKFSYKRLNHFRDWLKLFQGKECTEIPDEVYKKLRNEIRKYRLRKHEVTYSQLRTFLKKLKLNGYYEHIPFILKELTGKEPPVIPKDLEEQFIVMFMETQDPFDRHKPAKRKNFLSYSYVLHKFCELLERDDFAKQFSLLKNREKLYDQDKIWEKICEDLGWEFIPSV